jgi:hypothetical protein
MEGPIVGVIGIIVMFAVLFLLGFPRFLHGIVGSRVWSMSPPS